MLYKLSSGKQIEVFFDHKYKENKSGQHTPYGTICSVDIYINNDNKENTGISHFETESHCHPNDQFTKLKGRLHAFQKLFGKSVLTKEEREKKNLSIDNAYKVGPAFEYLTAQERSELFNLVFPRFRNTLYEDINDNNIKQVIDQYYTGDQLVLPKIKNYITKLYKKVAG